jgi:imidazolonepropionase-like amidohydrolase
MGWDGVPERRAASELGLMVEAGMSPAEALKSATSTAAYALGLDDLIGTIEPGKLADLVVVDGDPFQDLTVLLDPDRIHLVIQIGEVVAGSALERAI